MALNYDIAIRSGIWVVCNNSTFHQDQRAIIPYIPEIGQFYSVRQFNRTVNPVTDFEQYTILLNEIVNPQVKMYNNGMIIMVEPSFKITRFGIISDPEDVEDAVNSFYRELK